MSADGESLYTASGNDAAVARFDRDPATGALTYQGCITGETESGTTSGSDACAEISSHSSNGFDSGFDNLRSVTVSPDETSVYAVSGFDDAVVRFDRDPATGALTYQGCITGETESGTTSGSGACAEIADHSTNGSESGLDFLQSVAVSGDGTSVYAVSGSDDAVARFDRDPATGALTYQGCITGETESGTTSGSDACAEISSHSPNGSDSGLDTLNSVAASFDGNSVYVVTGDDDSVARFDRDSATGALTYQGCITGETESGTTSGSGACAEIPSDSSGGSESGLDLLRSVTANDDGTSVYAVSQIDAAVSRFDRDPATGALTYQGCITGETESGTTSGSGACAEIPSDSSGGSESGLDELFAVTASVDGESVYAVSQGDDAVANFDRDPATGALAYAGCITGETGSGTTSGSGACTEVGSASFDGDESGFNKFRSLTSTADGKTLYAASPADDAVARFAREGPPPSPPPDPYDEICFSITINGAKLQGGDANDKLNGTPRSDLLRGGAGKDKIKGNDAADCLFGQPGGDKVRGDDGADVIRGGSGNDKLTAGKGNDSVRAQDGDDRVNGGPGNDQIKAQARGRDKVNCGSGTDRVIGDVKDKISRNCEKVKLVDPN